jgi:hypothetical protein
MRHIVLVPLVLPFYLNDFANIHIDDWRAWLWIDYVGVKLFPVLVIVWLLRSGAMTACDLGLCRQSLSAFLAVFLVAAVAGTVIDQNGYVLIGTLPGYPALGTMPPIASPLWNWLDLTLGLLLVGVVEELVFRGYLHAYLGRWTSSRTAIVVISSAAFGLIHWSAGLHVVLVTSLIGALFMLTYLTTRALPPVMLAHFTVNFIDFAGVVPKSVFRLV